MAMSQAESYSDGVARLFAANGTQRAKLAKEMKLLFVTLHSGWQGAQREGRLKAYSDGVARLFATNGFDLRALRLTSQGFTGR